MTQEMKLPDSNIEELHRLLGIGAGDKRKFGDVLEDAIDEVGKERKEAKKQVVKEHIRKILEIEEQMIKLRSTFMSTWNKSHNELGKGIKRLKGMTGDIAAVEDEGGQGDGVGEGLAGDGNT